MEKGHYSVLRVSHLSQIDNFSIEQQKESIETYARLHSIEITSIWLSVVQAQPMRENRFRPYTG